MHLLFHRCLGSGAADVAFVEHIALESIEGTNPCLLVLVGFLRRIYSSP